jgi:hypothetical protein
MSNQNQNQNQKAAQKAELTVTYEVDGSKILSRIREELFHDRHKIKSTGNGCPGCQKQNKAADGYNPSLGQSGGLFASTGR